eukprot:139095_1
MGNFNSTNTNNDSKNPVINMFELLVVGFIRQLTNNLSIEMNIIPTYTIELCIKYYQLNIRYIVTSLWKRSDLAEGNPTHKPQTRILIPKKQQPVNIIPIEGMVISSDWHRDIQVKKRNWVPDPENRAILLQTEENGQILQSLFTDLSIFNNLKNVNLFGENVVIKRIDKNNLESTCNIFCIGDILEIQRNNKIVCELQIASCRWPCYKLDKRCNAKRKTNSVQKQIVDTSLGGIFCSVLRNGNICCGDIISIKHRIHNDLLLGYVAKLCYGGDKNKRTCLIDDFQGNEKQYQRLINCKELAKFEWKDRLEKWKKKQQKKDK